MVDIPANTSSALLSICIPTYNRCDDVVILVSKILQIDASLQVCVHVDGSPDGTLDALGKLAETTTQIRLSHGENRGRAHALPAAIAMASAPYTMLFDDDDDINPEGIRALLLRLQTPLAKDVCGYICHMRDGSGARLGSHFRSPRSNFLKLRFDEGLTGDKKEIIKTEILKEISNFPHNNIRRSPTSIIFNKIALDYDVECLDIYLGVKIYHRDGYTRNIARLKLENPVPMWEVNRLRVLGFLRGRHRSLVGAVRSAAAALLYGAYIPIHALQRRA